MMLPIIDYGEIAVVIPEVSAVGSVVEHDGKHGIEIYLNGRDRSLIIGGFSADEAEDARKELIGIIAQYYYIREFGPDFELDDIMDEIGDEESIDNIDLDSDDKKEH